jgi:hypothetical protein
MKKIAFILCCLFFVVNRAATAYVAGNPASACYNVHDADARTMCLARAHREPGQCYSIQRADLRAQCLAEVRR